MNSNLNILIFVLELFDSYDPEVGFGGIHGRGRRKQDPPIERELYLTLEEVFKGCVKKMKISRRVRTKNVLQYACYTNCMVVHVQAVSCYCTCTNMKWGGRVTVV